MSYEEIERKFLVVDDGWRPADREVRVVQGYVVHGPPVSVRVRTMGDRAYLTVKGGSGAPIDEGRPSERTEYEYAIPIEDAESMLATLCTQSLVEKTRHYLEFEGNVWEIDVFEGENAGLIVAEVEQNHADQSVKTPPWVGPEVTRDARYLNANLSRAPYRTWRGT